MIRISLVLFLALIAGRIGATGNDGQYTLSLINQARANAGLAPLAVNSQLTAAAQAHAEDMSRNGVSIGHIGSDGSTPQQRMSRAGYRPYSWGPFVGENWAAYRSVDDSISAWLNDPSHRRNILRPEFREIGIGVAPSPSGAPVLVTDFGSQPNVLPVFVNGAGASITLTLTNEDAAPEGDGADVIGRAVRVEVSAEPQFSSAWQMTFASSIPYSSVDGKPVTVVYVRFFDARGRSTVSMASAGPQQVAPAVVSTVTVEGMPDPTAGSTRGAAPTRKPTTARPEATASPTASRSLVPPTRLGARLLGPPGYAGDPGTIEGDAQFSTPVSSETVRVRYPSTPHAEAYVGAVASREEPLFGLVPEGLAMAVGIVLVLAGVSARQRHKR